MAECFSCLSLSGERRISPGPTIYDGRFWAVEHAYPVGMKGWLVLVLKRHAAALHELTGEEFEEFAGLLRSAALLLRQQLAPAKEYVALFAEKEHFEHVHVHVVARSEGLEEGLRGTRIFSLLKVEPGDAIPPEEIAQFCRELRAKWNNTVPAEGGD